MKYCIGCKNLQYTDKEMSHGSSMTGSWTSEEASMSCKHGHWKEYLDEYRNLFNFAKAMEKAESCADYEERQI